MSRWFRVDDGLVDDPKVQQLPDRLFRAVINLWCVTSQCGGNFPPIEQIAFKLRVTASKAEAIIAGLRGHGLIDDDETGSRPHNWNARQFKSDVSTERVKHFRERQRNVSSGVSETAPETDTEAETKTDSDQKEPSLRSGTVRARGAGLDRFDEFWQAYPHKVGKQAAFKAFERIAKTHVTTFEKLMAGLGRYRTKTDDRPWCNPATWLNEHRWEDQPAPEVPRNGQHGKSILAAADRLIDSFGGMDAARAYVPGSAGPAPLGLDFGPGPADIRRLPKG